MALIACPECRNSISREAKSCPHCGKPRAESPERKDLRQMFQVFGVMGVVILGYVFWSSSPEESKQPSRERVSADGAMPAPERAFVAAVQKARSTYNAASNDMAKGAARPARATDICAALKSAVVTDWAGIISTLSSNGDGKGVLGVSIGDRIDVSTWNNGVSDISDHTLIDPNSDLFRQATALSVGRAVRFTGTFIPSPVDCARESSVTLAGSITEPSYVFRFSRISPLTP